MAGFCGLVQASYFLQDTTNFGTDPNNMSTVNTAFEILLQPGAGADGFRYDWKPISDLVSTDNQLHLPADTTLFQINGSTPCCIPVTPRLQSSINTSTTQLGTADNQPWRWAGVPVTGQLMGACNMGPATGSSDAGPSAMFSYQEIIYQPNTTEIFDPQSSPMALVIVGGQDLVSNSLPKADPSMFVSCVDDSQGPNPTTIVITDQPMANKPHLRAGTTLPSWGVHLNHHISI